MPRTAMGSGNLVCFALFFRLLCFVCYINKYVSLLVISSEASALGWPEYTGPKFGLFLSHPLQYAAKSSD